MALRKCKECGDTVSSKATACPQCGAVLKQKGGCLKSLGILLLILIIGYLLFDFMLYLRNGPATSPVSKPRARSDQSGFQPVPAVPPTAKSESSTDNVSAPITQPAAPIESPMPKHWVTVVDEQGTTEKNTDTFTLHGGKAKLTYSFRKEGGLTGAIYVLPEGHVFEKLGGIPEIWVSKTVTDSTFLIKKAGNYYLKVISSASWEVKIEEEI